MTVTDASRALQDIEPTPLAMPVYDWRDETPTRELVEMLQRGEFVETRAFVKPIFKWMKTGVRKSGQRNDAAVEKAFAFVAWMEQLKHVGDQRLQIAPQPQLDATYALNTIVTSAQRASSRTEAERAVAMLKAFGYTPDVFAYTALIDVVARSRDVRSAFERYEEMRASISTSRPNLVVFLTVIRAIGFSDEIPTATCLTLMDHARRDGVFDDSLYVRTIELCAKRRDGVVATHILAQLCAAQVEWKNQPPILRALQRVLQRIDNADAVLADWLAQGFVTPADVEAIQLATSMMMALYTKGLSALGCARHVSDSARLAVMHHAIDRLLERQLDGATISTSEFETLIHQCRKRKRKDDVLVILDAMREIATIGWTIGGGESLNGQGVAVVPPQPQLAPNSATYAAVVETFLACNDADRAWEVFLDATTKDFVRDQLLYRKYLRGCCLLMDPTHIVALLRFAREDNVIFTTRMLSDLAKMHGQDHTQGIDVVLHQIPLLTREDTYTLLQEMANSCAASRNTSGVRATITAIRTQGLPRTATTDLAVLECCLACVDVHEATTLLLTFQSSNLLLDSPVYASLIREIFFKCTRNKVTSRTPRGDLPPTESRRPALKMLHLRRGLVETLAALQQDLETDGPASSEARAAHVSNDCAIAYWTHHSSVHAPMLFLQHFVEATATILDKAQRTSTITAIQTAVQSTTDPVQFIVSAVGALPSLSLPFRAQSKIAKQLFALLPSLSDSIQSSHVEFCLAHLDSLSIHVVKELDEALHLVGRPSGLSRVLSFCETALLERGNNTEKIVAFLLSRPELCANASAAVLAPTLAHLFVNENDALVLQYFRPCPHSITAAELTASRIVFIREVIRLDQEAAEAPSQQLHMRSARRAIMEFKLEHEAEFLPLLMAHSMQLTTDRETLIDKSSAAKEACTETGDYLQLPLSMSRVILVDDDDSLQFAYEVLMYEGTVKRIALDAEWRPLQRTPLYGTKPNHTAFTRCALLQIACDSHVFLLDLLALEIDDLEELLAFLFDNDAILKLGFRLDGDLQRLRYSYPSTTCFDSDEVQNVLDLSTGQGHTGLSTLILQALGQPLDKSQQCSDWEQRPLTKQQIAYAALDAYCLLLLHDHDTSSHGK